ncbi:hypothetical protein SeMB42_g04315 [Synchytrium endobioticum]|uniref:RING-type domain-containing protein n=1 Tax=Synchytrium endobioticum TaxID=286115 RepID=A0A507CZL7_9FUNG|nr:hypothetical protein SeMB42_g04315 [Synchytrium endobioticum]
MAARISAPEFLPSRGNTIAISDKRDAARSSPTLQPQRSSTNSNGSPSQASPRPRRHQSNQRKGDKRKQTITAPVGGSTETTYYDLPTVNKRGEISLNHVLNFTFPERQRFSPSTVASRRRHQSGVTVYNKERFVNANFRFVMRDSGDYTVNVFDPDIFVEWKEVVQVVIPTLYEPTCPICLSPPSPAKATRCGHVFCYACVLHYLALGDRQWRKCPICYDAIYAKDLRSVKFDVVNDVKPGTISEGFGLRMVLMKRLANSIVALPRVQHGLWLKKQNVETAVLPTVFEGGCSRFAKLVASSVEFERRLLQGERDELMALHLAAYDIEERIYLDLARTQVEAALADLEVVSNGPDRKKGSKKGKAAVVASVRPPSSDDSFSTPTKPGFFAEPAFSNSNAVTFSPNFDSRTLPLEHVLRTVVSSETTPGLVTSDVASSASESMIFITPSDDALNNGGDPRAADGTHVYLHPLDIKVLMKQYGDYSAFPDYMEVGVLSVRESSMDEDLRRRYLSQIVSPSVLVQFSRELSQRERRLAAARLAESAEHCHYTSSESLIDEHLMPALRHVSPFDLEPHIPQGDKWGLPPGQISGSSVEMSTLPTLNPLTGSTPPGGGLSFARMATSNANTTWVMKAAPKQSIQNHQKSKPDLDDGDEFHHGDVEAWALDLESAVLDGRGSGSNSNNNNNTHNKKKKVKGITLGASKIRPSTHHKVASMPDKSDESGDTPDSRRPHPSPTGSVLYDRMLQLVGVQAHPTRKPTGASSPPDSAGAPPSRQPGPPTTPAEQALLESHIRAEVAQLTQLAHTRAQKSKDLDILAHQNCADLELAYHECLSAGPLHERTSFCRKAKHGWSECVQLQKMYLVQMGYYTVPSGKEHAAERQSIADRADDAYLREMRDRIKKE